jgi:glycosyltransferase involved in cell wall biosynthesis
MKKILHLFLTKNKGGIESYIINNWKYINKNKFMFYFALQDDVDYSIELGEDARQLLFDRKNIIKTSVDMIRIIRRENINIVHIHKNSLSDISAILTVLFFTKAKVIIHSHNTRPKINAFCVRLLHKLNKKIVSLLSVTRLACSSKAANWMFGDNDSVVVFYNGIDFEKFKFDEEKRRVIRGKYKIRDNTLLIGLVANLIEQKNIPKLIRIFLAVKKQKTARLMLVGDGPLKEKLKAIVDELDENNNVFFVGAVRNVSDYLSAFDAMVMPSFYEGLPISAIECQANGCPLTISSNVDRMVEITNAVRFLSVNDADSKWGEAVLDNNRQKKNVNFSGSYKDFNIGESVKKIEIIYSKM